MGTNDIHGPNLPGVRTLGQDSKKTLEQDVSGDKGITFLDSHHQPKQDKKLTVPEPTVQESTIPASSRGSFLTNTDDVFNVGQAFEDGSVQTGTIVTDKRHARSSLKGVFSGAFNEWWGNTHAQLEDSYKKIKESLKTEKPTVTKPEDRKEVIQEAAKHTAQAPRDDHKVLVEKLKTLSHDAERVIGKPFVIKNESEKETPEWKHTVSTERHTYQEPSESGAIKKARSPLPTLDLRKVSIAPTIDKRIEKNISEYARPAEPVHTHKKPEGVSVPHISAKHTEVREQAVSRNVAPVVRESSDARFNIPKHISPPEPISIPSRHPEGSWATAHDSEENKVTGGALQTSPSKTLSEKLRPEVSVYKKPDSKPMFPKNLSSPFEQLSHAPIIVESVRHREMSPQKPPLRNIPSALTPPNTLKSLMRTIALIAIIVVGSVFGIIGGIMFVNSRSGSDTNETEMFQTVVYTPSFFATEKQSSIPLGTTRVALLTTLLNELENVPPGVVQLYPVVEELGINRPATTEEIVAVLKPRTLSSFLRTLGSTFMIGGVVATHAEPFLILKSNNFDVAFAGMLQWESSMSEDLAPLFGSRVTATLFPTSDRASSTTPRFTDALRDNRSIRVLYDETGTERIIYAFVNRNTIVITTSTNALSIIIGKIK